MKEKETEMETVFFTLPQNFKKSKYIELDYLLIQQILIIYSSTKSWVHKKESQLQAVQSEMEEMDTKQIHTGAYET